jgi:PPP family 3-phenylpropionic acid transporter
MYLKLYVDLLHSGAYINYGVARGMGSLAYVIMSVGLGAVIQAVGIRSMPVGGLVLVLLQLAALFFILRLAPPRVGTQESVRGSGLLAFVKNNLRFSIMLLGTALIFFSHNALCNFLINVTRAVGGGTGTMGYLNGFMAAVEIPVMLLYAKTLGKRNSGSVLRWAFIFFALKACAMALASSVPALFAAFILQAPSYAVYTSAIVHYVEKTIAYEDSAKAQSLAFTMTTVGSVLASVIAGRLYDILPSSSVLWIAAGVCAAGVLISVFSVKSEKVR